MRRWSTVIVALVAALLLSTIPHVSATGAEKPPVMTFGGKRIVTQQDADKVLKGTPKAFRVYVVGQLKRERAVCSNAPGSAGVAGYHRRGFAVGDISVDNCLGFGVVWKRGKRAWKRVAYLQDSPRCAVLRKAGVPRALMRRTGWKYCYNADGDRVLY